MTPEAVVLALLKRQPVSYTLIKRAMAGDAARALDAVDSLLHRGAIRRTLIGKDTHYEMAAA